MRFFPSMETLLGASLLVNILKTYVTSVCSFCILESHFEQLHLQNFDVRELFADVNRLLKTNNALIIK